MVGKGRGCLRESAERKTIYGEPRTRISVTLPTWIVSEIRDAAAKIRIPVSGQMTELLTKELGL